MPSDDADAASSTTPDEGRIQARLEERLGVPFTRGNRVQALRNGVEIFPAMLQAIEEASHSVELETFIYWSGAVAERMAEALADASRRGVEVRVLLDAAGCLPMDDELRTVMREAGVEVRDFGPLRPWRFWELDHRTHRKILVCDGRLGFTGGVGIAEEWEGDVRSPEEWRETHFALQGPAVQGLRGTFLEHWLAAGEESDDATARLPDWGGDESSAKARDQTSREGPEGGEARVQVIASTAAGRWSTAQTLFRALVDEARHSVQITTAYFVPEPDVVDLLCGAAERGVEVDILHPGPHIDHRVSQLAGEAVYPELLDAGVRIWRYQKSMIHAKVLIVDGVLSCIGSVNLNHRSAQKDDEVALNVLDRGLAARLSGHFHEDLTVSEAVARESLEEDLPWWRRVAAKAASMVRAEV